jgi:type VI secretion system protein VasG
VRAAVELSARYIPSRQLPDKAVSVIDTACARVSVSQSTIPAAIADKRQRLSVIAAESAMLEREALVGSDNHERQKEIAAEEVSLRNEIEALEQRWDRECEIVKGMALLRSEIESSKENEAESADFINKIENYEKLRTELSSLQQEKPLVHPLVDKQAIAEVVQNWTGIPTGKMQSNQINSVLNMRVEMENRIVGQSHAIVAVSQAIMTSRAGLTDPRKPVGVFLMVGPSGVGKTETALTIADLLYGGENSITTINMSEFKEEHKVSLLMGSPPGYVGYGEGGVLTEAVRRKPHSVILLDEMEKAHPGVQDVFFQVFDKGHMRDGEGRDIDFKNSLIIMTSNACSDLISQLCADPDTAPEPEELAAALKEELRKHFKDAFLGRVNLVPYLPLSTKIMKDITVLQLNRIRKRLLQSHRVTFNYDDDVIEDIVSRCRDSATGARNIENILTRSLLPDMSSSILESLARGEKITSITVGQIDNRYVYNMS